MSYPLKNALFQTRRIFQKGAPLIFRKIPRLTTILCLLLALLFTLSSCQLSGAPTSPAHPDASSSPATSTGEPAFAPSSPLPGDSTELFDSAQLKSRTHEYGETEPLIHYGKSLSAAVFYPVGNLENANRTLRKWAESTLLSAEQEMQSAHIPTEGKLSVSYDSFFIQNRYVSVLEEGSFSYSSLAHPMPIIYTLNVDAQTGSILSFEDVFPTKTRQSLYTLLSQKIKESGAEPTEQEAVDQSWFSHFVLGSGGIQVIFPRGEKFASALGNVTISLPYAEVLPYTSLSLSGYTKTEEKPATAARGVCTASDVAVRLAPSTQGALLGRIGKETPLEMLTDTAKDGWYEIWYHGQRAYIAAQFVRLDSPSPTQPSKETENPQIDPSRPMVALSFDDGPSKTTSKILDVLEKHGGRATFCVVGSRVNSYSDTLRRISSLGCEIASHTWDHKNLTKLSAEEIKRQLLSTQKAVKDICASKTRILRPPYGAVNDTVKKVCQELDMAIANWYIDTEDWKTRDAKKTASAILDHVQDGDIILCHDLYPSTGEAMESVIPALIERGYQLVTISELLEHSKDGRKAGVVYRNNR